MAGADGSVYAFAGARSFGSLAGSGINAPVVAITSTPDGNGYWLAAADGGVFAFGDARYHGSEAAHHLNAPVVAISTDVTPGATGWPQPAVAAGQAVSR